MNRKKSSAPFTLLGIRMAFVYLVLTLSAFAMLLNMVALISPIAISQQSNESNNMTIILSYANNPNYDSDNNGIEESSGIIDLEIGTNVSAINQSNLCARWDIFSIDNSQTTNVCHGASHCCAFLNLVSASQNWSEPLLVSYGTNGASAHNLISSQLVHVQYNLENPSSNVFYSNWQSLSATFESGGFGALSDPNELIIGNVKLTIAAPNQSLSSGENASVQLSTNTTTNLTYKFLNSQTTLSDITQLTAPLTGLLPFNILENKAYNITLSITNESKNYSFAVNDQTSPKVSINLTNATTITSDDLHLTLNVSSDEHAVISYNFNNQGASSNIDLGQGKHTILSLIPVYGTNTLAINSIDLQGNSRQHYFTFTYSQQASCTDGTQNGNEQGIDCGGSCSACIEFQVSLDKASFNQNEDVYVTIIGRQNSYINLTVYKDGTQTYAHIFTPVFSGAPIAETRRIENTHSPGSYGILAELYYMQNKQTKTLSFEVIGPPPNPLQVSMGSNTTTINEGNPVTFTTSISGANGGISYAWDFNGDKVIDSTEANPSYVFGQNGTYRVNVTVSDSQYSNSAIQTITARKTYNLSITVKDNATQSNLPYSLLTLDGNRYNTSDSGSITITHPQGTFTLRTEKESYRTLSEPIDIHVNEQVQINLTRIDITSPSITLVSPAQDSIVNTENISLIFRAADESEMTCSLFFEQNESIFASATEIKFNVPSNQDQTFIVNAPTNLTYKWRVDCVDRRGNHNASAVSSFKYDVSVNQPLQITEQQLSQNELNSDLIEEIDSVIDSLPSLGSKEQQVANLIQLREYLDRSRLSVERTERDLNSLIWRKLNDSDLEAERQNILNRVEEIRRKTPRTFTVMDTTEFVKYADKENVRMLLETLLNKTTLKLSKKEMRSLIDETVELQNELTVTTKAHTLQVEYISGETGFLTIIEKTLDTKEDQQIYEVIPKQIAESLDEITFITAFEPVEDDPIIKVNPGTEKLVYYIFKKLHEQELESTQTIMANSNFKERKNAATGFSILDTIGLSVVKTTDIRLIVEILVILLLAAIYLVYSFGGLEQVRHLLQGKEAKELYGLMDMARQHVSAQEYEKAMEHFKQVQQKYNALETSKKDPFKKDIVDLTYDLNLLFIDKLVKQATTSAQTNRKEALALYQKIQSLYKIIPRKHKQDVSKKCLELHQLLAAK